MSFPKHAEYKNNGAEWLGEVPLHWEVPPCRAIVTERSVRNDDGACEDYLSLMANIGVIPYADKGDIGNKKPEDLSKCKMVHEGDFVINSMNYYIGSYGISPYNGVCSPVYIVLTPRNNVVDSRFAFRIFEDDHFQEHAQSFGNGILEHRRSINWDILKTIPVPVPPLDEQRVIASFLDGETSKIDGLVSEQRHLIELLKEKRQAVISHAVTKGLDPNAPMKPSGIQWLGDVPQHWDVVKLKHVITGIESGTSVNAMDEPASNEQIGVLKTSSVYTGKFDPNENKVVVESELNRVTCPLRLNTIIVSRMNTPDLVGAAGLVKEAPPTVFLPDRLWQVSFHDCKPTFVYLWTLSSSYREQIKSVCTGTSSSMKNLTQNQFGSLLFCYPPEPEQQVITECVERETATLEQLIAEAERAIELLQERRSALISAAVTGKIDVREFTFQEAV